LLLAPVPGYRGFSRLVLVFFPCEEKKQGIGKHASPPADCQKPQGLQEHGLLHLLAKPKTAKDQHLDEPAKQGKLKRKVVAIIFPFH